jgi:hypothetical protein
MGDEHLTRDLGMIPEKIFLADCSSSQAKENACPL